MLILSSLPREQCNPMEIIENIITEIENWLRPSALSATKRSYPTSEVRGSSRECQAETVQEQQRGATPRLRSGVAAKSARLQQHRSSQAELPHARRQGRWRIGATPRPRSGGCTGAGGRRGATPRFRSGGAAVRRYPSSKVRSSTCTLLEQP